MILYYTGLTISAILVFLGFVFAVLGIDLLQKSV